MGILVVNPMRDFVTKRLLVYESSFHFIVPITKISSYSFHLFSETRETSSESGSSKEKSNEKKSTSSYPMSLDLRKLDLMG